MNKIVTKLYKKVSNSWENKFDFKAGNLIARLKIDSCISKIFKKADFYCKVIKRILEQTWTTDKLIL